MWFDDLTKEQLVRVLREGCGCNANLRYANLHGADLRGADLRYANLYGANLGGANLRYANLHDADLRGADLRGANLRGADLRGANLHGADLRYANLHDADLRGADLDGAKLPHYQICPPTGSFRAWKKVWEGDDSAIIEIEIPEDAQRTSSIVGRKCRASKVKVISGKGESCTCAETQRLYYEEGKTVEADSFDPDPRVECTHGIHFFVTRKEAEDF